MPDMRFWTNLLGYKLVWLALVIGAGHGRPWPGVAAASSFVVLQLWFSRHRVADVRLLATGLLLGLLIDTGLAWSGSLAYASAWPSPVAPIWILALWGPFAMTLTQSTAYLQGRPWLATSFGAVGGPLAYLGAASGWRSVTFQQPAWHGIACLALAWGIAMPLLASLARRWSQPSMQTLSLVRSAP